MMTQSRGRRGLPALAAILCSLQAPATAAPPAASAPAATIPEAAMPLDPRFSPLRVEADVTFLADALLEGRETGKRGHEIAALFVAQRFAALGLKPGGDDGSWFQRVPLVSALPAEPAGALVVTGPSGMQTFPDGGDIVIRPSLSQPAADITAPVVFVGYGVSDARLGIDDYKGLDVKGKVVVVLRGFPNELPSEAGAFAWDRRAAAAQAHGAIGLIMFNTDSTEKMSSFKSQLRRRASPRVTWIGQDGKPADETPGIVVTAIGNDKAAAALFAGTRASLPALRAEAARRGGRPKGFALKTSVRIIGTIAPKRLTSRNVIAVLPGSDPALAPQSIVLSAHLDHLGISPAVAGEPAGTDHVNHGALDNAAGVATVLEVARVLTGEAKPPRRSIVFAVVTGEEEGLLGADYFAHHPTPAVGTVVGDVNLDMPVLLYPFTGITALGAEHSTIGAAVAAAAAPMKVTLGPDPNPTEVNFIRSDNYAFVKQGIPAVSLDLGYANGGAAATADFLEHKYHQPGDSLTQPINWRAGARFAELNWRIAATLANADAPPLWLKGDLFGDTFAPGQARAAK